MDAVYLVKWIRGALTHVAAGKVAEIVEEGKAEVKSNKGNTISKNASEDDPAVVIERSGVSLRTWRQCGFYDGVVKRRGGRADV